MSMTAQCVGWAPDEVKELEGTRVTALRVLAGCVMPGSIGFVLGSYMDVDEGLLGLVVGFPGIGDIGLCKCHFHTNISVGAVLG